MVLRTEIAHPEKQDPDRQHEASLCFHVLAPRYK